MVVVVVVVVGGRVVVVVVVVEDDDATAAFKVVVVEGLVVTTALLTAAVVLDEGTAPGTDVCVVNVDEVTGFAVGTKTSVTGRSLFLTPRSAIGVWLTTFTICNCGALSTTVFVPSMEMLVCVTTLLTVCFVTTIVCSAGSVFVTICN